MFKLSSYVLILSLTAIILIEAQPLEKVVHHQNARNNNTEQESTGNQQLGDNFGLPGKSPSQTAYGQFLLDQSHLENLFNEIKQEESNSNSSYVSPNGDIFWLWTHWPGLNAINQVPGWSQFQQQASTYTSPFSGPVQTLAQQFGLSGLVDQTIENPFAYYLNPANHPLLAGMQNVPNLADIPMIFMNGLGQ